MFPKLQFKIFKKDLSIKKWIQLYIILKVKEENIQKDSNTISKKTNKKVWLKILLNN